ncbi:MAG: hypothetical protein IIB81_03670 [Nanoarchaeota archaeon]|nr:hypothetical protein [Nanoarchaeota archaeon]
MYNCERCGNVYERFSTSNKVCPDCYQETHQGTPKGTHQVHHYRKLIGLLKCSRE